MTDEQIEYHIGLEKVRNVIEGFDENYGIDKIRNIVKEIKKEKENMKMTIKFPNPEDIDKMIEKRQKQYEDIKDFVNKNPYPNPEEMGRIIQNTIEKGFPAKPMRKFYHRDLLEKYIIICLMKIK